MLPKFFRVVTSEVEEKAVWIHVIADVLGFSYEVVHPADGEGLGRTLPNGSWTGGLGMIQRREADLAFGGVTDDEEAEEAFRMSYTWSLSEITFMTKKYEHAPNPGFFLDAFSTEVWFAIFSCVCLTTFIFYHLMKSKNSAFALFTPVVGCLLGRGTNFPHQRPREYVVLVLWILSSAFLYYFYAAVLLSFLTFPSRHGVLTIEDLANGIKSGKYQCATYPSTRFHYSRILAQSADESLRLIGRDLLQNEGVENPIEFLETSTGDKKPAFIGLRSDLLRYKGVYFVSEENLCFDAFAFVMNKDFCCSLEIDKAVLRGWGTGIYRKMLDDANKKVFSMNFKIYGKYWGNPPAESPLTMSILKGPFLFLITFHSLSFILFLIELSIEKFDLIQEQTGRRESIDTIINGPVEF